MGQNNTVYCYCVFWQKLKRKHLPDYLKLEKHISLGSQIWIASFSLQAYEQTASFEYPRGKKREIKWQISEPLQNPRKIQKSEFKTGSSDSALSSTELILYFEQCCIATLGLVQGLSTASNNSRAAKGGHSCAWPQHLAFIWRLSTCWKSWGESCSGKKLCLTSRTWWDRPPWLSLSPHTKQCHKTTSGDGLTKYLQQSYCM